MGWDYIDDRQLEEEEYLEQFLQESLKGISQENAKSYLGKYGDAVDERVLGCILEAKESD